MNSMEVEEGQQRKFQSGLNLAHKQQTPPQFSNQYGQQKSFNKPAQDFNQSFNFQKNEQKQPKHTFFNQGQKQQKDQIEENNSYNKKFARNQRDNNNQFSRQPMNSRQKPFQKFKSSSNQYQRRQNQYEEPQNEEDSFQQEEEEFEDEQFDNKIEDDFVNPYDEDEQDDPYYKKLLIKPKQAKEQKTFQKTDRSTRLKNIKAQVKPVQREKRQYKPSISPEQKRSSLSQPKNVMPAAQSSTKDIKYWKQQIQQKKQKAPEEKVQSGGAPTKPEHLMCCQQELFEREEGYNLDIFEKANVSEYKANPDWIIKKYGRPDAGNEEQKYFDLQVLENIVNYLCKNIVDVDNEINPKFKIPASGIFTFKEIYSFCSDRLRAVKKDIQMLEGWNSDIQFSKQKIEMLEWMVRFIIIAFHECQDISEEEGYSQQQNTERFTDFLTTLLETYEIIRAKIKQLASKEKYSSQSQIEEIILQNGLYFSPYEAEFLSYQLLINIYQPDTLESTLSMLYKEEYCAILNSKSIQFALKIINSIYNQHNTNYVAFFKLLETADYLTACLMTYYLQPLRIQVLKILFKSYDLEKQPQFTIKELKQIFGFTNSDDFEKFLFNMGVQITDFELFEQKEDEVIREYFIFNKKKFLSKQKSQLSLQKSEVVNSKRISNSLQGTKYSNQNLIPRVFYIQGKYHHEPKLNLSHQLKSILTSHFTDHNQQVQLRKKSSHIDYYSHTHPSQNDATELHMPGIKQPALILKQNPMLLTSEATPKGKQQQQSLHFKINPPLKSPQNDQSFKFSLPSQQPVGNQINNFEAKKLQKQELQPAKCSKSSSSSLTYNSKQLSESNYSTSNFEEEEE